MESINDLPAHVLLVHAPVVLLPLTTLAALVVAARPGLRRRAGVGLAVATGVVLVATWLAKESGEAFDELLDGAVNTSRHESLAETTMVLVLLFFLGTTAAVAADWWGRRGGPAWLDRAAGGLMAVSTVVAVVATVWMVRTGDEGARLVWDGVVSTISPPGG